MRFVWHSAKLLLVFYQNLVGCSWFILFFFLPLHLKPRNAAEWTTRVSGAENYNRFWTLDLHWKKDCLEVCKSTPPLVPISLNCIRCSSSVVWTAAPNQVLISSSSSPRTFFSLFYFFDPPINAVLLLSSPSPSGLLSPTSSSLPTIIWEINLLFLSLRPSLPIITPTANFSSMLWRVRPPAVTLSFPRSHPRRPPFRGVKCLRGMLRRVSVSRSRRLIR